MLILPGLLETLELSQRELNDPEAYVLPSLDDPHTPLSFQADTVYGWVERPCNHEKYLHPHPR